MRFKYHTAKSKTVVKLKWRTGLAALIWAEGNAKAMTEQAMWRENQYALGYPSNKALTQAIWRSTEYLGCFTTMHSVESVTWMGLLELMLTMCLLGQRKPLLIPVSRINVASPVLQRDVVPFLNVQSMVQYLNPLASLLDTAESHKQRVWQQIMSTLYPTPMAKH